jgi:arylsulfatase A-like enzyme
MTRRTWLGLLASVAIVTVASTPAAAQQAQKSNFVFILADNVGYGDLGAYGGGELRGAPTPNTDRLASEGLRLARHQRRARRCAGRRTFADHHRRQRVYASGARLHHGRAVHGRRLCHRDFRQVAPGQYTAEPADRTWFDEFYGIPPGISWDAATYVDTTELTHSIPAPPAVLLARGPQIVEATAGGPLRTVKPFTPEVRANIDYELVDKSIDFMRRQKAAGKPFFLYLPFSMGHVPNLPSEPGIFSASASMAGYPKVFNIEMDPHESVLQTVGRS